MIRRATREDRAAIELLLKDADALHYTARPDVWRAPNGEDGRVAWMLSTREHAVFVATEDDEVIGFVHVVESAAPDFIIITPRKLVHLTVSVVRADRRGRGVARRLLEHAEEWARARGVHSIELNVAAFNDTAVEAWQHLGFSTLQFRMEKEIG